MLDVPVHVSRLRPDLVDKLSVVADEVTFLERQFLVPALCGRDRVRVLEIVETESTYGE